MEARPTHNEIVPQLLLVGTRGQPSICEEQQDNDQAALAVETVETIETVSVVHLPYKVQGGTRKADGSTVQEASRTSGFVCP